MWPVTSQFAEELKKPVHEVAVRVDFLNTSFQKVRSVYNYSSTDPNDALIDGTIDLDVTRGTRRTIVMSFLNPDGTFTADGSIWSETPDWDGYFYINRLIRVWRGVKYSDGSRELVPVGTFMVDKAETLVERGMSTVVISGSDLWKKFSKSQFGKPRKFTEGSGINTIIKDLADEAGITQVNLDPLNERGPGGKQLARDFVFEADITRGEAVRKLADDMGVEVFFDPMGVLVSREFSDPFDRATVWSFDQDDDMAFFMRSVIDDDRLYNHAIVVGTAKAADGGPIYRASLKDNDPSSPTSVDRIGDRVFRYESPLLGSQEAVDKSVRRIFYRHFLLGRTVALEAVCNPALEGNDVIRVAETKFSSLNQRFLINSMTIPLVTSKQKITVKKVVNVSPA